MTDVENRVRARAYRLWQEEGCPVGRELAHWEKAKELVAIEDNQLATTKPIGNALPYGEPVEPHKCRGIPDADRSKRRASASVAAFPKAKRSE